MLILDAPPKCTPIVSGLCGLPLPVYTSLITLNPPTQHLHCELFKRTSYIFMADQFEVTIGILYNSALKNLPTNIFRYCFLSLFPTSGQLLKTSLSDSFCSLLTILMPLPFFPLFSAILIAHSSDCCHFPSHSSLAIRVYLIFLTQSRFPKPF